MTLEQLFMTWNTFITFSYIQFKYHITRQVRLRSLFTFSSYFPGLFYICIDYMSLHMICHITQSDTGAAFHGF